MERRASATNEYTTNMRDGSVGRKDGEREHSKERGPGEEGGRRERRKRKAYEVRLLPVRSPRLHTRPDSTEELLSLEESISSRRG